MMNNQPKRVTIMTIGKTGEGKSAFGNLFLNKIVFNSSSVQESCTQITSSAENIVNGTLRTYIDTQGIVDTEDVDDRHVSQMIDFLRCWDHGVNAIGIVINGQCTGFDQGTRRLLKSIHVFFNNNEIWNSVFIVFTKWFRDKMTEAEKAEKIAYVSEVRKVANECIGYDANPQIPCFFVDSKSDLSKLDDDTKQEITQINAFASRFNPLSTKGFKVPNPYYFKLIPEIEDNVLIKEDFNEIMLTRTRTYANRVRNKQISYNGTESYSDWIYTKTWPKIDKKIISEEVQEKIKIGESREPVFRTERSGGRRYVLVGPRTKSQVYDHTNVTTTYEDRKRIIIRDYDGNVSYGDWVQIRTYTEITRI